MGSSKRRTAQADDRPGAIEGPASPNDFRSIPNLDLLRSCAVGFVVLSHVPFFAGWPPLPAYSLKALGHLGVVLFFVHTTLVLMMSLERQGPAAIPFLARRFFRIYPLSVAVVLLFACMRWLAGQSLDMGALLSNLLLVQNITGHPSTPDPLWTLPYEVQMYALLPTLYAVTRSYRPLQWLTLITVASVALALVYPASGIGFIPCFLQGVFAFLIGRRGAGRIHPGWMILFVIVAALGVPALVAAGWSEMALLWVFCAALGMIIPRCRQIANRALANSAKMVATYSYGIYLTHVLALGLAFNGSGHPDLLAWCTLFVLLPGFGYLAYHGIEKHGIALGIRLTSGRRVKPRTGVASSMLADG